MELNLIFNHRIFFAKIYFFEVILFLNIFLNIKTYYTVFYFQRIINVHHHFINLRFEEN